MFDFDVVTGPAGQIASDKAEPKDKPGKASSAEDEQRPRPDDKLLLNGGNAACR